MVTVQDDKLQELEKVQNEVARIVLVAPKWTKVTNLQLEASLPPLSLRVKRLAADFLAKVLQAPEETTLSRDLKGALERAEVRRHPNTWLTQASKLLDDFDLRSILLEKGTDLAHPDYQKPPPRQPSSVILSVISLPGRKSACDPALARALAEERILALMRPESAVYYTERSINPNKPGTSGAAFVTDEPDFGRRLSDGSSTYQTEATAIRGALEHTLI